MNIYFKQLHIHHFLSFDDSIIDLNDRGYCLVSGINRNPKDAAKSNGSGKSTIWNAVSFVLTGETLQGLKSNLGNIYFKNGCWVSLTFTLDGHEYILLRSKDDEKYGTNLKIIIDGVDRSGKGIRESEQALAELLPDITSELLGSVILLGQGMPQKFTNNTPAKRKEILEHLSKSDFMIADLKQRVEDRSVQLNKELKEIENALVANTSKASVYNQQLEAAKLELASYTNNVDYNSKINKLNEDYNELFAEQEELKNKKTTVEEKNKEANQDFSNLCLDRQRATDGVRAEHGNITEEFNTKKGELSGKIASLSNEINRLKSIKDVCPTCGRPFDGVVKPDTKPQEDELNSLTEELKVLNEDISKDSEYFKSVIKQISDEYDSKINSKQQEIVNLSKELGDIESRKNQLVDLISANRTDLAKTVLERDNYESNLSRINKTISDINTQLSSLDAEKGDLDTKKDRVDKHLDVVSKMSTYLKRDFRGYLLTNVINYIQDRAKTYCSQIFGSNEIVFALNGNDVDISYCGKDYENLSGGEKQRVDLIIQFAIRDMLCNQLGFSSNILVLDEITDNLDSVSCDKVLNFITKELSSIESVFIISHHSDELAIPADSEIIVVKNELGISEVA